MEKDVETITFEYFGHRVTVPLVRACPAEQRAQHTFVSCGCGRDYIMSHPYPGPIFPADVTCPFCGSHDWEGIAGCSGDTFNATSGAPRLERLWRRPNEPGYISD
jgi:hypothetical protein